MKKYKVIVYIVQETKAKNEADALLNVMINLESGGNDWKGTRNSFEVSEIK